MRRFILVCLLLCTMFAFAADRQSVLIRTPKPYDKIVAAIQAMGGTVTYQYKYVNGIAAELPVAALSSVENMVGADNIAKDEIQSLPTPAQNRFDVAEQFEAPAAELALETDGAVPADYSFDNALTHASTLHAAGYTGSGVIIAVIDTGYRPMFTHVSASRIIAPGLNFVPASAEPGKAAVPAIDNRNYPHGTQVAGLAAANTGLCFTGTSNFAVLSVAFGAGIPNYAGCGGTGTYTVVWMIGTAPAARIFPVKIFPTSGAGAPSSRIIAAMDAVIDARVQYDAGDTVNGLNIKVANMSLGGGTSIAGRGLEDEAADAMLAHDILLAVAAGNEGFSSMTVSQPATSVSALSVGAASNPANWRIALGTFYTPCGLQSGANVVNCVLAEYPDNALQMADFSSRGPTHDGRIKPDVIANGSYNFVRGSGPAGNYYGVGSGTSFSTPLVAGIAASLRQAVPGATARQIRNAIIATANPTLVATATRFDQGNGFVDASAALDLLRTGSVPDTVQTDFVYNRSVAANLARVGAQVNTGFVSQSVTLRPGALSEVRYKVEKNTSKLYVRIRNVTPGASQNVFFGDDVLLRIQSAVAEGGNYRVQDFVAADAAYAFDNPEEGIWRITPSGDYTNASPIAFTVDIWAQTDPAPQQSLKNTIVQGEWQSFTINVPTGTQALQVLGSWVNMYGSYPVNDVDFYLIAPDNSVNYDCATGRAPELCAISNPLSGTWTVLVNGYSINALTTPGDREAYTLRIAADGAVLTAK